MAIMIHANFHLNRLMLTWTFGICTFDPPLSPLGHGERPERPGVIWLMRNLHGEN